MRRSNFLLKKKMKKIILLINKQWFLDIPLHQQIIIPRDIPVLGQIGELLDKHYALAAPAARRLSNECELGMFLHVRLELLALLGQLEAPRAKLDLVGEGLAHPVDDVAERFLAGEEFQARVPVEVRPLLSLKERFYVLRVQGKAVPDQLA
jgi:hypothetical protein